MWAIKNGRAYICQVLVRNGADRDVKYGPQQMPVLVIAVRENQQRCLETLHQFDCSTEETDKRGQTALITAAEIGRTLLVKELCVRGANVDAVDHDGCTALIRAALVGQLESVACLLDYGASLEISDKLGRTALIAAALSGGEHTLMHGRETVMLLLDRGAQIEARDHGGDTALLAAVRGGSVETAQLLLLRGADHSVVANDGDTALHRAASKRHQITPFSSGDECKLTEMICRANAMVDQKGLDGESALHRGASRANQAVVDVLIRFNADVNLQTYCGETAAMACVAGGCRRGGRASSDTMRTLVESNDVDLNLMNDCGTTVVLLNKGRR